MMFSGKPSQLKVPVGIVMKLIGVATVVVIQVQVQNAKSLNYRSKEVTHKISLTYL